MLAIQRRIVPVTKVCARVATFMLTASSILGCSATSPAANQREVRRETYGEKWPFTVERGTLSCVDGSEVLFTAEGRVYALNGRARGRRAEKGYLEIEPIHRSQGIDSMGQIKVSVGDLISEGLTLCRP